MRRERVSLHSPHIGSAGDMIAYGHHGRPVLVFPSEGGRCTDYEDREMIASIAFLIEAGRAKVYCVDSYDHSSWLRTDVPAGERAHRHGHYEEWVLGRVVPWIFDDCAGEQDIVVTGCSFGAFHAANFALKRADRFPLAICHSGVYDLSVMAGDQGGQDIYFNNPMHYVANLHGDHLEWLRSRASLLLICGQGQWEDTTGALDSTKKFGALLEERGIKNEVDLWGYDVPHDWPSWRAQIAHHLPRFC